ncbi:MAG: hypothetical protein V1857_05400 [archaeon]
MSTHGDSKGLALLLVLVLLTVHVASSCNALQDSYVPQWVPTPPVRVIMRSTADWVKMMFDDDLDGRNRNGIRIVSVLRSGWLIGGGLGYEIMIGRKVPWHDVLYNTTVEKFGDMITFNKGPNDFNYTEVYADLIFEVDTALSSGYVWIMLAGSGVTSFELANLESKHVFWHETLVGTGHTSHIRRLIMIESFFRTMEVSPLSVMTLIVATLIVIFALSPSSGIFKILVGKFRSRDLVGEGKREASLSCPDDSSL